MDLQKVQRKCILQKELCMDFKMFGTKIKLSSNFIFSKNTF